MKGSFVNCRFCQSTDLKVNRANETIQCENCDRILEERYNDSRVTAVNVERESPYCVIPNDALAQHKFEGKLEGDPFHASGFITAFSYLTVQQQGAFTLTARTFAGDLAELERILADLDIDAPDSIDSSSLDVAGGGRGGGGGGGGLATTSPSATCPEAKGGNTEAAVAEAAVGVGVGGAAVGVTVPGAAVGVGVPGAAVGVGVGGALQSDLQASRTQCRSASLKLRHALIAYFTLLDIAHVLPVSRDEVDEALRLLNKYSAACPNVRSKNIEALAVASLVLVLRRAPAPGNGRLELPELASASGLLQKDLIQGIKNIQHGLDTRLASSCSSISSHMPHFCAVLGMQGAAEKLAIEIGENAMVHSVCLRRNPMSIAAAAIYLACNLEDQKKTQTEICKVTGLTEVTLRKVYKELLVEHQKIIPPQYVSKVRLQTLLPVSMSQQSCNKSSKLMQPGTAAGVLASSGAASAAAALSASINPHIVLPRTADTRTGRSGDGGGKVLPTLTVAHGGDTDMSQIPHAGDMSQMPHAHAGDMAHMSAPFLHQYMMSMSQAMMAMAPEQLHHMMAPEQIHHHLSAMANHQLGQLTNPPLHTNNFPPAQSGVTSGGVMKRSLQDLVSVDAPRTKK